MNDLIVPLVFLAHLASSLVMVGLIWFVQVVHYPLFAKVDRASFTAYEQRHTALTTWVVAPPMLIEGATAVTLFWFRPPSVEASSVWIGIGLLLVVWSSTALIQVPCHHVLSHNFDSKVHQRLVWTNWLRTVAWSLRGLLVLYMAWSVLR